MEAKKKVSNKSQKVKVENKGEENPATESPKGPEGPSGQPGPSDDQVRVIPDFSGWPLLVEIEALKDTKHLRAGQVYSEIGRETAATLIGKGIAKLV